MRPPRADSPTATALPSAADEYARRRATGDEGSIPNRAGYREYLRDTPECARFAKLGEQHPTFPRVLYELVDLGPPLFTWGDDVPEHKATAIHREGAGSGRGKHGPEPDFPLWELTLVELCQAAGLKLKTWTSFSRNLAYYGAKRKEAQADQPFYIPGVSRNGVDATMTRRVVRAPPLSRVSQAPSQKMTRTKCECKEDMQRLVELHASSGLEDLGKFLADARCYHTVRTSPFPSPCTPPSLAEEADAREGPRR